MSGLLAGRVWQSDLPAHLKPLAAALADCGNDDGSDIYPGVRYTAWKLSTSDRKVQTGLKELRSIGVLVLVADERGGRGRRTEYRMVVEALPERLPWNQLKGATSSPFENQKGETSDTKGCNIRHRKGEESSTFQERTLTDPSLETSLETSKPLSLEDPKPEHGKVFTGGWVRPPKKPKPSVHDKHAWCGDRFCVWAWQQEDFIQRLGSNAAKIDLPHFYQTVCDDIGDDPLPEKFSNYLERRFAQTMKDEFGAVA